jgi:hypothetical protein
MKQVSRYHPLLVTLANPDIGVTQIAHRLGVSPATLYRYIPTREPQTPQAFENGALPPPRPDATGGLVGLSPWRGCRPPRPSAGADINRSSGATGG